MTAATHEPDAGCATRAPIAGVQAVVATVKQGLTR
jgi:hypothetical protein